jgi:glycosyltransferase involved in cell wall biosynthesis
MFFTITIQTYNHADGLAETLGSLAGLRCPEDTDYEILVVDNNSSDRTRAVIQEFSSVLGPRLRGLFEPRQGLSHARNLALAEARGDVICFIDDDAVADPDWLAGHAEIYGADEHVVAVAGRIELQWPAGWSRPPWLSRNLESYLSGLDLGPERMVMEYPRYPYGCNMSVRRAAAEQVGGFSTRLGRQGHGLRSNEERHFFHKIHGQGGRVIYTPGAVVHHVIPAERLSRRFFLRRAYAQGVSDAIFRREVTPDQKGPGPRVRAFLGGSKLLAAVCLRASVDIVSHRDSATCFLGLARGVYAAGYIVGAAGITP